MSMMVPSFPVKTLSNIVCFNTPENAWFAENRAFGYSKGRDENGRMRGNGYSADG
jgi:hypothetical protein